MSKMVCAAAIVLAAILGAESASAQPLARPTYSRGAPRITASPNGRSPGGYAAARSYASAGGGGARGGYGYGRGVREYGYGPDIVAAPVTAMRWAPA